MRTIKDPQEMHQFCLKMKGRGKTIAFVPTMGFLHEGHLSLVDAAKHKAEIVVVSIFVNPTQFGPREDLSHYPRDLARDKGQLNHFDVDILFLPETKDLYSTDFNTILEVDSLSKKLCGKTRTSHFRGVTTIVAKLLNIVSPDYAFFGEKDYQQQLIIKRMVEDLNFPCQIISLPTVREFDGLAMSSRNTYLTKKEREQATILYKALLLAKEEIENGEKNSHKILLRFRALIGTVPSMRLEYASIVNPDTLDDVSSISHEVLVAVAVQFGKTRLIDNMRLKPKE